MTITVVCDDKTSTQLVAQPPFSIQILNMFCTGFSDKVTLSPYYSVESNFPITDKMAQWVLDYSISNVTLWAPFQSSVVNHTAVTLPKKLAPLPIIPMGRHIHELNEIQKHKQKRGCSFWTYLAIISAVLLIMGLATAGEVFYLAMDEGLNCGLADLSERDGGRGKRGSLTQIQHRWLPPTQWTMMTSTERLPRHRAQHTPASAHVDLGPDTVRFYLSLK